MTDLGALTSWIDGYLKAWNSNDPEDIGRLFAQDATYRTEPWKKPWQGRAGIVHGWLEHKDEPGETTFAWEKVAIEGDVAVIRATTRYPDAVYSNLWVLQLDAAGQATAFSEWWMQHPTN